MHRGPAYENLHKLRRSRTPQRVSAVRPKPETAGHQTGNLAGRKILQHGLSQDAIAAYKRGFVEATGMWVTT